MDELETVKQWYEDHGLEYQPADWEGSRLDTGESADYQHATNFAGRPIDGPWREMLVSATPGDMWWWEDQRFPWNTRPHTDWEEVLEFFVRPYLPLLSEGSTLALEQWMYDRMTYQEMADKAGIKKQSAHERVSRALRELVRVIAEDDPDFTPARDKRRRDLKAEFAAAERVFHRYLDGRA